MPNWLVNVLLPYLVPFIITAATPIIVEYVKKASDYIGAHVPGSVWTILAAVVASGVAEAQSAVTGYSFPPLAQPFVPLIGIFLNELGKDFGKQPPTPGLS